VLPGPWGFRRHPGVWRTIAKATVKAMEPSVVASGVLVMCLWVGASLDTFERCSIARAIHVRIP
jgi:hypothetical protein